MLKKMFRKIVCTDPKTLEFITGFQAVIWGLWLSLPQDTFSASTTYAVMRVLAPEGFWGIYFLSIGIVQIVALHLFPRWLRSTIAILVLSSWIFIDLGFWVSGSTSAATATYMTYVLVSLWSLTALIVPDRVKCRDSD